MQRVEGPDSHLGQIQPLRYQRSTRAPRLVSRSACGKVVSPFLENLVHHRNRDRSFPNRRRNTLHIARPYIPYGKHSRKTGFEQIRSTRQRPMCGRQIHRNQVYARLDASSFIERQTACKPARVRVRSHHQENVPDVAGLQVASLIVAALHVIQPVGSLQGNDLSVSVQRDCFTFFNPANQIARHRVRQAPRSDHHVDMFRCLRQKYSRLTGGIAPSNNDHLFVPAQLRLKECCPVVHAIPFESLQVFEWELAVFGSGGDDHRPGGHSWAAFNFDNIWVAPAIYARLASSDHSPRAEFLRLRVGPPGQFLPRDSHRESQVVFDFRTGTGLPPWSVGFDDQDIEPLRSGVNRGRKSRWSCADYDNVADLGQIDSFVPPKAVGYLLICRIAKYVLSPADDNRHITAGHLKVFEHFPDAGARFILKIDVRVRISITSQEFLDSQRA